MFVLALLCAWVTSNSAQEKKDPPKKEVTVFTNPAEAGPDFKIQGEYVGVNKEKTTMGVQVVALGGDKFDVFVLKGGLPGDGWDTKDKTKLDAVTTEGKTKVTGKDWSGEFVGGELKLKDPQGAEWTFKKVERKSKTLGEKPPADALVLFDGKDVTGWKNGKLVEENLLFCGTQSTKEIGAGKLHIEFRTPYQPKARGQGRGNSGVFIQGTEIQVLDSFGLTGANNECGAFYSRQKPTVNMCYPPLSWQTYDVEIKESGENVVATVWHNGVLVHENFVIKKGPIKPAIINLQNHSNPVMYRNIWFVEKK